MQFPQNERIPKPPARSWLTLAAFLAGFSLVAPGPGMAEQGPAEEGRSAPPEKPWYDSISVHAIVSGGYSYNFNKPSDHRNAFRVYDFDDHTFKVDMAALAVQRTPSGPRDAGFRMDLAVGSSVPRVAAASGLFRDPETGEAHDFDVLQAFGSYVAPAGKGLRLDVGKFFTSMGYEILETYEGWSDNATRSFMFLYAIPGSETGIRASYPFHDKLTAQLRVINGWDVARDNNSGKSVAFQLVFAPAGSASACVNYMAGPEQNDDNDAIRQLWDLSFIWKAAPHVNLAVTYDNGREEDALGPGRDASWSGVAGYVRTPINDRFALTFRAELFDDGDGARTGVPQRLKEITFTPEYKPNPHVAFRCDIRRDWSDTDSFPNKNGFTDRQSTVGFNVIVAY